MAWVRSESAAAPGRLTRQPSDHQRPRSISLMSDVSTVCDADARLGLSPRRISQVVPGRTDFVGLAAAWKAPMVFGSCDPASAGACYRC